jgi:hypothetical protein
MNPKTTLLTLFSALSLAATGWCAAPTPDDEARFLAGMPVSAGSPLQDLTTSPGWMAHATAFNKAWATLEKRQLQTIDTWAPATLGHFYTDTGPLLYFFSGPDFLYAHEFFPNASTYVLCGIEDIGPLPQVENLPTQTLSSSLNGLLESLDTLLNFSFFVTKKMAVELKDTRLSGTLPVIYVFLVRSGCHITDVSFASLDPKGEFVPTVTHAKSVKIEFTGPAGQQQTLYYFDTDLSDGPVDQNGFLTWCATLGPSRGFLKAASYLMHNDGFSSSRKFLLAHCDAILQDDSGIPMRFFPGDDWDIKLFGNYSGPIDLFKNHLQQELVQMKAQQKPSPLPFSVGYRWHSGQSSLIFAVKATHATTPTPAPAAPAASASPVATPVASPVVSGSAN